MRHSCPTSCRVLARRHKIRILNPDRRRGFLQRMRPNPCQFPLSPVVSNVIGSLDPGYRLGESSLRTFWRRSQHRTSNRVELNSRQDPLYVCLRSTLTNQSSWHPIKIAGKDQDQWKGKMKTYWVGDEDLLDKPDSISTVSPYASQSNEETIRKRSNGKLSQDEKSH